MKAMHLFDANVQPLTFCTMCHTFNYDHNAARYKLDKGHIHIAISQLPLVGRMHTSSGASRLQMDGRAYFFGRLCGPCHQSIL